MMEQREIYRKLHQLCRGIDFIDPRKIKLSECTPENINNISFDIKQTILSDRDDFPELFDKSSILLFIGLLMKPRINYLYKRGFRSIEKEIHDTCCTYTFYIPLEYRTDKNQTENTMIWYDNRDDYLELLFQELRDRQNSIGTRKRKFSEN